MSSGLFFRRSSYAVKDRLDLPEQHGIAMLCGKPPGLFGQRQSLTWASHLLEHRRLIDERSRKTFRITRLAADSLLFFEQGHRPVQIPASPQDQPLVAQADRRPSEIAQLRQMRSCSLSRVIAASRSPRARKTNA